MPKRLAQFPPQQGFVLQTAPVCGSTLLQPLLHARVKHRLIGVPVHVLHPGNRTDDEIPTSRQGL